MRAAHGNAPIFRLLAPSGKEVSTGSVSFLFQVPALPNSSGLRLYEIQTFLQPEPGTRVLPTFGSEVDIGTGTKPGVLRTTPKLPVQLNGAILLQKNETFPVG